jgi:hypothetical protein
VGAYFLKSEGLPNIEAAYPTMHLNLSTNLPIVNSQIPEWGLIVYCKHTFSIDRVNLHRDMIAVSHSSGGGVCSAREMSIE